MGDVRRACWCSTERASGYDGEDPRPSRRVSAGPAARISPRIGHRGASGHTTENTLAAFARPRISARRCGNSMPGDPRWRLRVSHDDHFLRVFGLDRRISELTAAELAACRRPGAELRRSCRAGAAAWRRALCRNKGAGVGPSSGVTSKPGAALRCVRLLRYRAGTGIARRGLRISVGRACSCRRRSACAGGNPGADIVHLCWEPAVRGRRTWSPPHWWAAFGARTPDRALARGTAGIIAEIVSLPVVGICSDLPEMMRPEWTPWRRNDSIWRRTPRSHVLASPAALQR